MLVCRLNLQSFPTKTIPQCKMRTRFLPTDYSATAAGGGPLEAIGFVLLPLPDLPPPDYPSSHTTLLQSLDDIPVLEVCGEIEKLPIDDALSIFLSDVLPHSIDGGVVKEPMVDRSKEKQAVVHLGDKDGTEFNDKGGNGYKFVQFETPEMDIALLPPKSTLHSQIGCMCNLIEIPESSCTSDQLESELTFHDHVKIEQLLYSVDEVNVKYSMEEDADLSLEGDDSFQGKVNSLDIKFPLFEVDAESPDILGRIYTMEEILIFQTVKQQEMVQSDEIIRNNKELLGSMEFDLIKYLFHHHVAIQCLEDSKFASQLDLISHIELPHYFKCSTNNFGGPDDVLIQLMDPIVFDEFLFFDLNQYLFHEMFSDAATVMEVETCESLFGEAMNFRSFSELIVCHELALMDDSFKALPIPIFSDDGNSSLHTLVREFFTQLDWQSSSVSDTLYLDWCFLEDDCVSDKYASCQKMLWEIDTCYPDAAMNFNDSGKLIFDFIISESQSTKLNAENCGETSNLYCGEVSTCKSAGNMNSSSLSNRGDGKSKNADISVKPGVQNVTMLGESMSSDLEFFLNPHNYFPGTGGKCAHKSVDSGTVCQLPASIDDSAAPTAAATGLQQKWNVRLHQIWLSDAFLRLIDYLWKEFLVLLEKSTEFVHIRNQYRASNDLMLLHIPNEKLKQLLQEKIASNTSLAHSDGDIMVLAMMFAIKEMAFCLCYYGIQATYLYVDSLSVNLQCMKSRLDSSYNLIRDENLKAENVSSLLHPSVSVVQEILKTELNGSNTKVLIVSDKVFLGSLKRLLTSLKISFNEPQHLCTPSCQNHCLEITDDVTNIMLHSDCCLASHQYVSASFPFSKFNIILEYGGSNPSSRISSICTKSNGLPTVYFLKVKLEGSSFAKALCYGVDMPTSIKLEMKRNSDSTSAQTESKTTLEELLCVIPFKETCSKQVEAAYEYERCNMMPSQSTPVGLESKQTLFCKSFCANAVIIVNTRNFIEEMIISRRSTYQRILEMERDGAQVVERDISLPVDIILSSAVCLTWYDCRNIGKKVSAPDEAFSCLPLCVESIATSILTSLSFAFSCCILIFEGECSFLCSIMESSDELYAAAASLGIDLQIFCSYSSETTEEIILSCINIAAELTRGLYPKMSDTESLAESFLTSFPSINPLAAHAVLSSDISLGKFLELSNEDRIHALQKYKVPDESIALMSATSRYGEREDSKSGVTDCSSSLSIPDSENLQPKSASERRKPNYTHTAYNTGIDETSNRLEEFNLSLHEKLLDFGRDVDVNMTKTVDKSSHCDFLLAKGLQILDEREDPWMPQFDFGFSPRWKIANSQKTNFRRQSINASCVPQENFTGEVIDVDDARAFREHLLAANSNNFSFLDIEKESSARNSRMSKQPHITPSHPMFQSSDIDSAWVTTNEKRQTLRKDIIHHFDNINKNNISMINQKGPVEQGMMGKSPQNFCKRPSQEKGIESFGGTPLSNALNSTQLQQGSPWTIEFLNRIREKSRLRSQSVSYELSSTPVGSSGNTLKNAKRKSPSILEFYKYGRGGTPEKTFEEKRLKRSSRPGNSLKSRKASTSCPPAWTPADKRARRALSFSTNGGGGGQSKLVWRDTSQRKL